MLRLCCLKEVFHRFIVPAFSPVIGALCCVGNEGPPQTCIWGLPSAQSALKAPFWRGQAGCPSLGRDWHLCWPFCTCFPGHTLIQTASFYFFLYCEALFILPFLCFFFFSIFGRLSASPKVLQSGSFTFLIFPSCRSNISSCPSPPPLWCCPFPITRGGKHSSLVLSSIFYQTYKES